MRTTESHLSRKSLGMKRLVEYTDGAFRNTTLPPDRWGQASDISSSWHEKNPRTASIIRKTSNPHSGWTKRRHNTLHNVAGVAKATAQIWPRSDVALICRLRRRLHHRAPPAPHRCLTKSIRPQPPWPRRPIVPSQRPTTSRDVSPRSPLQLPVF
jgi:hypothetical protein